MSDENYETPERDENVPVADVIDVLDGVGNDCSKVERGAIYVGDPIVTPERGGRAKRRVYIPTLARKP